MRGPGGQVRVRGFPNEFAEAHWVTAQIVAALAGRDAPGRDPRAGADRVRHRAAAARAGARRRAAPRPGLLGLYERTEVRDALAYLTLIANPVDAQAFRRAIGSPRRGIGAATVTKLVAWAREHHGGDLIAASARAGELDGVRAASTARG